MMTARKTNNEQMAEIAMGLLEDNVFLTIEDKFGMIFKEEESTEILSESNTDEYK